MKSYPECPSKTLNKSLSLLQRGTTPAQRERERGETCIIYQQKLQYQLLFPALDLFQLHCAMPNVERRGSCGRVGNERRMAKCALHLRICLCLSPRTSSGRMTAMLLRHVRCPKWHSHSFTANQIRQSKDPLNKLLSHEKIQLYCHWSWSVTYSIFFHLLYLRNTD